MGYVLDSFDSVCKMAVNAADVASSFRVAPEIYLIGSLERGVTVYSQQVRAHNLVWALHQLQRNGGGGGLGRVAVVGGGIAGLTVTACLLSLFDHAVTVTLFERLWDLCPIQQGTDTRWLHPRIYDWPRTGSRAPRASLPILDWSEGRASDVARNILKEFGSFANEFAKPNSRLGIRLGLRHFQIDATTKRVSWIAHKGRRAGPFVDVSGTEGHSAVFDTIILTAGFGLESEIPEYPTLSYWRNEQLGQPALDGTQTRFLVSGFGDGALVDLCRLTIERFRQDTIIYEMFDTEGRLAETEAYFREQLSSIGPDDNVWDLLVSAEDRYLKRPMVRLSQRLRKDTRVTLHLRGRDNDVKHFAHIFGRYSSFLHRLVVYLLYRCGAFSLDFSELSEAVKQHKVSPENVLCRYGGKTLEHLKATFVDPSPIEERLLEMRKKQKQATARCWAPGTFRHYSNRR